MALPVESRREPTTLTPAQGRELFNHVAQRITGLSGLEFLARYDAGEIQPDDETPEGRDLMYLILLIPFARQNS
jgi:hypothetical protein